jgi:MFS superfamily sulfate permease-like transporter
LRIREFEFSLRELAGSMGDFGTLFPLAIGYIVINGMNPAGLLVMMGLINITTGLVYRQPMPVEPMKVMAVTAIAQRWPPSMIYAAGFGTGVVWIILAFTGLIQRLAAITPRSVVRGIQVALGILLAIEGFKLISALWDPAWLPALIPEWSAGWILGIISIVIVIFLRNSRYFPATIVLVLMGMIMVALSGKLGEAFRFRFSLPPLTTFRPIEIWEGFIRAGFAQVFLTASNAVIATSAVIATYWPRRPVSERQLAMNMGIFNIVLPFFGGMPMCHGAGGYVSQWYFGARTGGANLMEGTIELGLGLFFSASIVTLFSAFPQSIIGAMLIMVGIELTKFVRDIKKTELFIMALTAGLSLVTNMAVGFIVATVIYHVLRRWGGKTRYAHWLVDG